MLKSVAVALILLLACVVLLAPFGSNGIEKVPLCMAPAYRAQVRSVSAVSPGHLQVVKVDPQRNPAQLAAATYESKDSKVLEVFKALQVGDLVCVSANGAALTLIEAQRVPVNIRRRLATFLAVALALGILTAILLAKGKRFSWFLLGMDNRYSKSKFQIAIWFGIVIVGYVSTLWLRWWASLPSLVGGVTIPDNLLLLSGISALSFGAAKAITQSKANSKDISQAPPSFPSDLVQDDSGQPDLGDFQMVVISILAVGIYFVQLISFLAVLDLKAHVQLPDVDPMLLGIFGISHGAYLVKKAASRNDGVPAAGGGGAGGVVPGPV
jgi:hypothetical protein